MQMTDPKAGGSFYLQSKVFRAHELLEKEGLLKASAEAKAKDQL